jgi:hypothetical protein
VVNFKSDISIFWSESVLYIAIYSIFALIVCFIFAALELYNQSTNVAFSRVAIKAAALTIFVILLFTVSLFIVSWKSSLFGGEIITNIVLATIWFVLSYLLNNALIAWCGLSFEKSVFYTYLPVVILMSPFIIFNIFVLLLGSAWKN